jgi:hypothetical protein
LVHADFATPLRGSFWSLGGGGGGGGPEEEEEEEIHESLNLFSSREIHESLNLLSSMNLFSSSLSIPYRA